ncbi:MAG TPA: metallophosphoesterase [Candidatus Elarobacter sp.]
MAQTKIVVLSDVHIGTDARTNWYQSKVHQPHLSAILHWIIDHAAEIRDVVLLGDIVDFWTYPADVRPPSVAQIVAAQPALFGNDGLFGKVTTALPNRVWYVVGNHDIGITDADVALLTGSKPRIHFVPGTTSRPLGNSSVLLTHGNEFVMANAQDHATRNPMRPLPLGHFVTRSVATYFVKKGLKEGQTVADLHDVGTPLSASYFKGFFPRLIDFLLNPINWPTLSIAKEMLEGLIRSMDLKLADVSPFTLADGTKVTIEQVNAAYTSLFSEWVARVGVRGAVNALVNDLQENLDGYAHLTAAATGASVVVMGHTHKPVNAAFSTAAGPSVYVNSGFECASIPDLTDRPPTFAVVDVGDATIRTSVLKVVKGSSGTLSIETALPDVTVARRQPLPPPGDAVTGGHLFSLASLNGARVSTMETSYNGLYVADQYYPTLEQSQEKWVMLRFDGAPQGRPLQDGDIVQIVTIENDVGEYSRLGAWKTPALFYSNLKGQQPYDQQKWIVRKVDATTDKTVHFYDPVTLENVSWTGQIMTIKDVRYLTTVVADSVPDVAKPTWVFAAPYFAPGTRPINSGDSIALYAPDRRAFGAFVEEFTTNFGKQYHPTMGWSAIKLRIKRTSGVAGQLRHGDEVYVDTDESGVGDYRRLGAFRSTNCYYYKDGYAEQKWTLHKLDPWDANLHAGQPFALHNTSWTQWLRPNGERVSTRPWPQCWWFAIP